VGDRSRPPGVPPADPSGDSLEPDTGLIRSWSAAQCARDALALRDALAEHADENSLRRYFGGVTIVAAFNAVVVGVGALLLDVPLAGTIAVVTFVTAYIPFIGAFVSGAFAVVLALGSEGTQTALIMLVIVLLANGLCRTSCSQSRSARRCG
jgi:hypothetical protein